MYPSQYLCACAGRFNINIFERIETFFRRLEIHLEVPPNQEMVDTITRIMVEILSILAMATKELKEGRMSESLLYQRYYR